MWPFNKREVRQAQNYTDARIELLQILASDDDTINALTGVVEACASLWECAFLSADTGGVIRPSALGYIGRQLLIDGEAVQHIRVANGRIELIPATTFDLKGSVMRPRYTLTINGPSQTETVHAAANEVVHIRYGAGKEYLKGIGGFRGASTTVAAADGLEQRLSEELRAKVGHVVPVPSTLNVSGLQTDLQKLKGKTTLVPSTASGWDQTEPQGRGSQDWQPKRIGANPPAVLATLRDQIGRDIVAAAGVPPILITGGDSTGMREGWRQFLHARIQPVSQLVNDELTTKLERDITLNFDRLMASDLSGRARAFQSMVGGGMDVEKAARLAGLMEAE